MSSDNKATLALKLSTAESDLAACRVRCDSLRESMNDKLFKARVYTWVASSLALLLCVVLTFCIHLFGEYADAPAHIAMQAPINVEQAPQVYYWIDPRNGCTYLTTKYGITPRMTAYGHQTCGATEKP